MARPAGRGGKARGGRSKPGGPQRPPSNTRGKGVGAKVLGRGDALRKTRDGGVSKDGKKGRNDNKNGKNGKGRYPKEDGAPSAVAKHERRPKEDRGKGKAKKLAREQDSKADRNEKGKGSKKFDRKNGKKKNDDDKEEESDFETVPLEKDTVDDDDVWQSGSDIASDDESGDGWEDEDEDVEAETRALMRRASSKAHDSQVDDGGDSDASEASEPSEAEAGESEDESEDDDDNGDDEAKDMAEKVKAANRKGKKSGGFQSMGLSYPVYKAIGHKGYKVPTPVQRRAIPVIMEGRDVVAMARTGSGKTAAFIIPLLEKLKSHSAKVGARGLILSPSRELALQTLKFVKDLGKHTDLRSCVLVGGDNMDDQFSAIASNPDILIATPGRLMHLIIEMNLDLKTIEYIVFDEADRLFEMGFAEQLREILFRLPEARQTLLFSATLPKLLVDFAKAGLTDPALIRLDVDTKISKDLQMYFLSVKQEDKEAALLSLFRTTISKEDEMTVIFVATKHHVEYMQELLTAAGVPNTYIYGALDQAARKIHLARFRAGKVKTLIVTDVAARGIDVPLLDNVINYDFPASNKVFVHRVGRAARAGRSGKAYSLVASDEVPFLFDLQLFTGRPLVFATSYTKADAGGVSVVREPDYTSEFVYGLMPPSTLALEIETVVSTVKGNVNLENLQQGVKNAYKMYHKSRPLASKDSYAKAKEISDVHLGIHPLLAATTNAAEHAQAEMIASISRFRPSETVFETTKKGLKTPEALLMQKRRGQFGNSVTAWRAQREEKDAKLAKHQSEVIGKGTLEAADEADLESGFETLESRKRKRPTSFRDENYISYTQADADTERGYAVQTGEGPAASFMERAKAATLELTAEDGDGLRKPARGALVWDKTKHDFVRPTIGSDNKKKMRTESGAVVNASFKSRRFEDWQKRTKVSLPKAGDQELADSTYRHTSGGTSTGVRRYRHNKITAPDATSKNFARKQMRAEREARINGTPAKAGPEGGKPPKGSKASGGQPAKSELKTVQQIAKERKEKEKRREKTGRHGKGGGRGGRGGGRGGGRDGGRGTGRR